MHHDDHARVMAHMERDLAHPRARWRQEFRVIWPDGSVHWLATSGMLVVENGEPARLLGMVIDITDRVEAEGLRVQRVQLEAENRQVVEARVASRASSPTCRTSCAASGVIGTLAGVLFGLLVAFNIDVIVPFIERVLHTSFLPGSVYLISTMPSDPQSADIVPITLISLVLSFVATLYPSWRASRVQPAEALRYE
ncbi:MAG: PAS domain-containing protein [Rhizobacter sp.]|nr:PAS domain-containing protein [Rhizobacter sp.]